MSFLTVDIGNTRLKWAIYQHAHPDAALIAHGAVFLERVDELAERQWTDLAEHIGKDWTAPTRMLGCVVASEAIRVRAQEQIEFWDLPARWVVPSSQEAGVINGYEYPNRLGSDRWVALIGARQRLLRQGLNAPALVVMVGTCVTVDALDSHGRFLGGLILPGFGLMQKALELGTAGLKVPTGQVVDFPTNTSDALMSGGSYALAGAIECQFQRLQQREHQTPLIFMAGGAAPRLVSSMNRAVTLVDTLIFEGLLSIEAQRSGLLSLMPANPPLAQAGQNEYTAEDNGPSLSPAPHVSIWNTNATEGPDAIHF